MFSTRAFSNVFWGDYIPDTSEDLVVTNSSVFTLTKLTSKHVAIFIQIETANIRFTLNGVAPVSGGAGAGTIRFNGDSWEVNNITAQAIKMIADQATSANVHVNYFRGR